MGRKAHANYIEVALSVLQEFGGGPISTKTLVIAAQERGLIGESKWVYHNFSRKIRESDLFDTSTRGQVSLVPHLKEVEPLIEKPVMEDAPLTKPQAQTFPGPTLGGAIEG